MMLKLRPVWALPVGAALLFSSCAGPRTAQRRRLKDGGPVVRAALTQIGKPYLFGGSSPKTGFDCSGLAWWAHRQSRIPIPRSSKLQFSGGRKVKARGLLPGDLVFFTTYRRGPSHVGIYSGKDRFIHAPASGKKVRQSRLSTTYWKKRYIGARRYW